MSIKEPYMEDLLANYSFALDRIKEAIQKLEHYGDVCSCGDSEPFEIYEEEPDAPCNIIPMTVCLNCGGKAESIEESWQH